MSVDDLGPTGPPPPTPYAQNAVLLAMDGWWPVPLPPRSKKSPPTGYTGSDGRTPTYTEIGDWTRSDPHANIAIVLGPDAIGIDVDAYGTKTGAATLAELEALHGQLPATVSITSREDGVSGIRLFRLPHDADEATFRTGWAGIDIIRHSHRYIVAPPSIHPDTNAAYRAHNSHTFALLPKVPPRSELPLLPPAWVAACAKDTTPTPAPALITAGTATPRPTVGADTYAPCKAMSNALANILEEHGSNGRARHDVARDGSLSLARLADMGHHGGNYAQDTLGRTHVNAITDRSTYKDAVYQWESMLSSAHAKVAQGPHHPADRGCCGADSNTAINNAAADNWLRTLDVATPTPVDTTDTDTTPTTNVETTPATDAEKLRDLVNERLPILNWHELWDDETVEEWIVEPLLAARRLIALYSAPKVGKSLLLLELAASISAGGGREILGTVIEKGRVVLYVDFENDPRADVRERLDAMGYGPDDLGNLRYLSFPTLGGLDSERGSLELMAAINVHKATIVVVDTVSRAVTGEENENDTWLSFYRHTGLKLKQAGVALIRLDHSGKDESKGQRGASAKVGDVDAVWRLSKTTDTVFRLICEANRMPVAEKSLTLNRVTDPYLRHTVDGRGWVAASDAEYDDVAAQLAPLGIDLTMGYRAIKDAAIALGVKIPERKIQRYLKEKKRRSEAFGVAE